MTLRRHDWAIYRDAAGGGVGQAPGKREERALVTTKRAWVTTRRASVAARLVGFSLALAALIGAAGVARAQDGIVETVESPYNTIIIGKQGAYVSLLFGYNRRLYTESLANVGDPLELPVEYTRYMTMAMAYAGQPRSMLEIGLGGGSTVWYLHNTFPALDLTVVELDPSVIEMAEKYFFVEPGDGLNIVARDGRIALVRAQETYDAILVDAYRGPFVPFHLLTKEFFEIAKSKLSPDGVMAQNIEPTTMLYDAAIATIHSVFDNVDVYPAGGNYVVMAYDGPPKTAEDLAARAAALDREFNPRYPFSAMLAGRQTAEPGDGQVLTDDFAPVEMLNATQRHNERMAEPDPVPSPVPAPR